MSDNTQAGLSADQSDLIFYLVQIFAYHSELRFLQLLQYLLDEFNKRHGGLLTREGFTSKNEYAMSMSYIDGFYIRDKDFAQFLKDYLAELRLKNPNDFIEYK